MLWGFPFNNQCLSTIDYERVSQGMGSKKTYLV